MTRTSLVVVALLTRMTGAQSPTPRLIRAPDASTAHHLSRFVTIRQLPNGALIVNDAMHRRLLLLSAALQPLRVIADTIPGSASYYGSVPAGIVPYVADSTLFVDRTQLSMAVIDPDGRIARVASLPRPKDARGMGDNVLSRPGTDSRGRIVYASPPVFLSPLPNEGNSNRSDGSRSGARGTNGIPPGVLLARDSEAIVRVDPVTRRFDTAGFYRVKNNGASIEYTDKGPRLHMEMKPVQLLDDFALLSDGTLAIVRGQDYHVDFVHADGQISKGPKIPFDWKRFPSEQKIAFMDSIQKDWRAFFAGVPDAPIPGFVQPGALPDYFPAFNEHAAASDADGNVWVRTTAVRDGRPGLIYDVIDRRGALIDRIQLPPGREIAGFGRGGVVYMLALDENGNWLERTTSK